MSYEFKENGLVKEICPILAKLSNIKQLQTEMFIMTCLFIYIKSLLRENISFVGLLVFLLESVQNQMKSIFLSEVVWLCF